MSRFAHRREIETNVDEALFQFSSHFAPEMIIEKLNQQSESYEDIFVKMYI